ncbi:Hcp family type VI secretion system effector [Paraburkholderia susongensis]|uniref:Type VI secretion system secreted protein Hcp n=1 Tax=Paraburkholderia susongensis TaxID=1515439 RepID=A0A1X7KD14_9BURK|nr:type VI secretion system tube protein Hcp [Paraburkholderia susongensis]SMG39106.1 type VI secretion system secreted protein Hcp [Paraburkholderia susongensis]
MVQDIFIKINGIDGESQDAAHLHEIDVIGWRWHVTQQSAMHSGSGGGAAKATVSDLEFTHLMDRASPNLAKYCFSGEHIPQAKLTMRKAGGTPHEYARITMYDVIVSHVEPAGGGHGCHEQVRLSFARMKHEYILQNDLGGSGGTVTALIDVKANRQG